jgi:hypothetical protein
MKLLFPKTGTSTVVVFLLSILMLPHRVRADQTGEESHSNNNVRGSKHEKKRIAMIHSVENLQLEKKTANSDGAFSIPTPSRLRSALVYNNTGGDEGQWIEPYDDMDSGSVLPSQREEQTDVGIELDMKAVDASTTFAPGYTRPPSLLSFPKAKRSQSNTKITASLTDIQTGLEKMKTALEAMKEAILVALGQKGKKEHKEHKEHKAS